MAAGFPATLVYSAHLTHEAIDLVLLYTNASGEPRALMMQLNVSGVSAVGEIVDKCKRHIKVSKPLRDFGIVDLSQITVCVAAQRRLRGSLAEECAGVKFHMVLLEPDQLRKFFGPSLMHLPFFSKVYGAAPNETKTKRTKEKRSKRKEKKD